jgi:hypothetical protein
MEDHLICPSTYRQSTTVERSKMQAIQSVLSVVDRHQSQLANWADKPSIDYEAFVTISTWVQTGFEVWLL